MITNKTANVVTEPLRVSYAAPVDRQALKKELDKQYRIFRHELIERCMHLAINFPMRPVKVGNGNPLKITNGQTVSGQGSSGYCGR